MKGLTDTHRAMLIDSAISSEVMEARGYFTATERADLERLGFRAGQINVPALVIPGWNVHGEIATHQIRPDEPRTNARGKVVKYETPRRTRMVVDVPPMAREHLDDPSVELFVTEGIKKADAAVSAGLCCVALLGVWNWRGTNAKGGKTALADWELIHLKDRNVLIVFDSDVTTKPEVASALERLRAFLSSRGARVQVIHLPAGDGGSKVGLDDFLAKHTVADLMALQGPEEQDPEVAEAAKRAAVRGIFLSFAMGFGKTPPHEEKVDRYVDVLADLPLDELEAGLDALKGGAALPAPDKIREASVTARLISEARRAAAEREAALKQLADPKVRAEMRAQLAEKAASLLECEGLLDVLVDDASSLGLVGEERAAKLIYLALQSRHFESPGRPVSIALKGASSAGKSWAVKAVARFLAPGSVIEMTGMSPKWMVYASQQGLDFSHRYLFVHEACGIGEEVEAMLRVLLSEGRIIWRTTIDQVAHTLVVEGPTGLVETTTRMSLHEENETRILSVPVDESTAQTRKVLDRMGRGPGEVDFTRWHALDQWIALGPRSVVIPFQKVIGRLARPVAPRVRRDLTTLLELVRAHALLHETRREVRDGAIVATLDDYAAVHELTRELFASAVELVVSPNVREVVQAVGAIVTEKYETTETPGMDAVATSAEIARRIGKDRRATNRWIGAAVEAEFLESMVLKRGQGITEKVRPGVRRLPPAEDESVFPGVEEIEKGLRMNGAENLHVPGGVDLGDDPHRGADEDLLEF